MNIKLPLTELKPLIPSLRCPWEAFIPTVSLRLMLLISHFLATTVQDLCEDCIVPSGLQIRSIQMPLTVSDTVSIMCSTDLEVTTIEWIRDGRTVVNSSSQSLTLPLNLVSVDHHNTQYTCRVSNLYGYGKQEKTVDITVQSKSLDVLHTVGVNLSKHYIIELNGQFL